LPFGFLWHQGSTKKSLAVTTLQSVDFIEPESPKPVSEIPVFEKPKSALDFLKMALPIFRKSPQFESLKEVVISPKMRQAQPILDAPLIEKKLAIPIHAPEIKLDASRSSPLSKIMEIPKISPMEKGPVSALQDSAINLEEVGRRSVPSPSVPSPLKIQEPTLQDKGLAGRSPAPLPEIGNIPSSRSSGEVLMDASKPSPSRSPAIPTSLPSGEKSGRSGGFSLEGPRAYSYGGGKAEIKTALPAPAQP
ncbi:MAG: hypothetical protein HYY63_04500, partial [Elusimicrobia bacterium]|nr:hypothetical protein [Elusimicrobiota bacterium]